jgi:transcription elongation factor GreA
VGRKPVSLFTYPAQQTPLDRKGFCIMGTERTVQLTAVGRTRLEGELVELRDVKMRDLYRSVQDANSNNEASDSGEYEEIKDELVYTEARVRDLEQLLEHAAILEVGSSDGVIGLGSRVTVKFNDGETESWILVTPEEASLRRRVTRLRSRLLAARSTTPSSPSVKSNQVPRRRGRRPRRVSLSFPEPPWN